MSGQGLLVDDGLVLLMQNVVREWLTGLRWWQRDEGEVGRITWRKRKRDGVVLMCGEYLVYANGGVPFAAMVGYSEEKMVAGGDEGESEQLWDITGLLLCCRGLDGDGRIVEVVRWG